VAEAGEGIEVLDGWISPGFVNCHCHLELSHLKGRIPMNTGLVDFVLSVMGSRAAAREEIQEAIEEAETEMLAAGIVAVGDICNTPDTLQQKSARRMAYYHFIELAGWVPSQAAGRFDAGSMLYRQFAQMEGNDHHLSISPHAPYSVSAALWDLLKPGFAEKTVSIHNQETAAEDAFFISKKGGLTCLYEKMKVDNQHFSPPGTTSLTHYLPELRAARNILLIHNTYTSADDIARAAGFSPTLFFCVCPNANLYIENRLPDIPAMIRAGGQLVIGTDSLASNRQLSVLEEMKTVKKQFPEIETGRILQWATSAGAKALQLEEKLGDFKPGKKPGIIRIDAGKEDPLAPGIGCVRIL
jgi:cytosine/adenosine deaminase-related metal-dependent hydrolase